MDGEVDDILIEAWRRVREKLRGDPAEVGRRLKRGREMWTKRPPRAWCSAVRASDRRITPGAARCEYPIAAKVKLGDDELWEQLNTASDVFFALRPSADVPGGLHAGGT